ncbi:helix-turn-helix transcriptional regulator [Nonomuraea sp. C10]|uniref:helix-turn-helix domain-containing protein n=1 Tax=Nonomuraea sp. C10 TaxID=2600577 RepID=UPI00164FFBED|nr:helix-turn-helix transcriptional regulator [Nonomuraea sp. C10]
MDGDISGPMSPRARFARELERHREAVGLSQIALSVRMCCHTSLISHIERGRRAPTRDFAERLDQTFQADGHFVGLFEQISRSPDLGWFARWVEEIEPQAVILQSWDPLVIPGCLQTPEYARALISSTCPAEQVEERVLARTRRVHLFDRPNAPIYLALVDENVLHRPLGSVAILADQLGHLLKLSQHPRITVQVVPVAAGCVVGLLSAFSLARLRGGAEIVSTDSWLSGHVTGDYDAVAQLKVRYETIRADAYSQSMSQRAIEEAAAKWANSI